MNRTMTGGMTGVSKILAAVVVFVLLMSDSGRPIPDSVAIAARNLPQGDIVFVIDESGSMQEDIAQVKARVNDIVRQLGASIDFRLGLAGFGASPPHAGTTMEGQAHVQFGESLLSFS